MSEKIGRPFGTLARQVEKLARHLTRQVKTLARRMARWHVYWHVGT